MNIGLFQTNIEERKLLLDPRTKLLMLITMSIFVLGGAGSYFMPFAAPMLCALPFICMVADRRFSSALLYLGLYGGLYIADICVFSKLSGGIYYGCYIMTSVIFRFLPCVMMAQYVMASTTVSEFLAAMKCMKLSDKIAIPMAVMFRLFPTILEEFNYINAAMKMRDIRIGGKNVCKMLEYRMVPLMSCSVQIGNELSAAALTRGLSGDGNRTNICKIGFHFVDIIMILICIIPYIGLLLFFMGVC